MKHLILSAVLVLVASCSAKHESAEVAMTDEVFVQNCLNEQNNDIEACKIKLVKKRIGYECSVTREKTTSTRIKKNSCTTALDRERIARNSDIFLKDFIKSKNAVQTPKGQF